MRSLRTTCGHRLVLAVTAICVAPVTPGYGDLAVPEPIVTVPELEIEALGREADPQPLRIVEDNEAVTHRVVIPAALIADLAGLPLRARWVSEAATTRSMVAGIAVSLAVGCGLSACRRGRPSRSAAVVLVGLVMAGGGAACLLSSARADVVPFQVLEWPARRASKLEAVEVATLRQGGRVIVELTGDKEEEVVFVVGGKADLKRR